MIRQESGCSTRSLAYYKNKLGRRMSMSVQSDLISSPLSNNNLCSDNDECQLAGVLDDDDGSSSPNDGDDSNIHERSLDKNEGVSDADDCTGTNTDTEEDEVGYLYNQLAACQIEHCGESDDSDKNKGHNDAEDRANAQLNNNRDQGNNMFGNYEEIIDEKENENNNYDQLNIGMADLMLDADLEAEIEMDMAELDMNENFDNFDADIFCRDQMGGSVGVDPDNERNDQADNDEFDEIMCQQYEQDLEQNDNLENEEFGEINPDEEEDEADKMFANKALQDDDEELQCQNLQRDSEDDDNNEGGSSSGGEQDNDAHEMNLMDRDAGGELDFEDEDQGGGGNDTDNSDGQMDNEIEEELAENERNMEDRNDLSLHSHDRFSRCEGDHHHQQHFTRSMSLAYPRHHSLATSSDSSVRNRLTRNFSLGRTLGDCSTEPCWTQPPGPQITPQRFFKPSCCESSETSCPSSCYTNYTQDDGEDADDEDSCESCSQEYDLECFSEETFKDSRDASRGIGSVDSTSYYSINSEVVIHELEIERDVLTYDEYLARINDEEEIGQEYI